MTEPEELEEDLFADLYDADDTAAKPEPSLPDFPPEPVQASAPIPNEKTAIVSDMNQEPKDEEFGNAPVKDEAIYGNDQNGDSGPSWNAGQSNGRSAHQYNDAAMEQEPAPIGIKEDGKMFIGGLNWETTDQSLKEYFSTFGEVQECTVMRDGASGRSRGFGFLTFRDPKTVNVVMVKEHYLDGKIIDPKRAIPRDEQERTSKIFVGGVSQDANEHVFKEYFAQFGRVVDATLMMDKDTGRPRGFGFVTFDSEAAVDATLAGDLQILGKPIEVKKAEPRGNMREDEPQGRRGGRGGGRGGKDFRDNDRGFDNNSNQSQGNQNQQGGQNMMGGMTPQMMAQYWQKMQQYFTTMQQQMASAAAMQNGGMGGMGAMNPAMMQQMQQMQQMKAMQQMQQAQMVRQQGSQSPLPQSPGAQGGMQGMNPAMLQQMQQMQQMQMQQAQAQQQQQGGGGSFNGGGPMGASPGPGFGPGVARRGTPGYNAQDQLAFEQQKYEQQQARRAAQEAQQMQSYQQGGPTSWEGMYDDVPQPGGRGGGSGGRGGSRGSAGPPAGAPSAPANAPTGPKNAGKPGANYRGGHGGRGGHRGFHPYSRNG